MKNNFPTTLRSFLSFVLLFLGTGFIAGSVVHFGEGITVWDSSVLLLGIILFVGASYDKEYGKNKKHSTPKQFVLFIIQSLLLALGIGMASGGTQHFIDTPKYAAILIPLGLSIGLFSYLWREKIKISNSNKIYTLLSTVILAVITWFALTGFNAIIPDSLRVGHGSHGHGHQATTEQEVIIDNHFTEDHQDDGHSH